MIRTNSGPIFHKEHNSNRYKNSSRSKSTSPKNKLSFADFIARQSPKKQMNLKIIQDKIDFQTKQNELKKAIDAQLIRLKNLTD